MRRDLMAPTCLGLCGILLCVLKIDGAASTVQDFPCGESDVSTLRYNLTLAYFGWNKSSSYIISGFINDNKFLTYDSKSRHVDFKSCEKADIQNLKEENKELRDIVSNIALRNGENGGSHTLQVTYGCKRINGDVKGFWHYIYDGQKFLSFSLEDGSWIGTGPEAEEAKKILQKSQSQKKVKAYILGDCPADLKKCLKYQECVKKTETAIPVLYPSNPLTSGSPRISINRGVTGNVIFIFIIILLYELL
ncbi:UL16-binding protein-like isoform X1 [Monodelphis domestica]|uniref:UL16-binding protein-like isoform X1 n=1 Tax=Monodelphis domestica TaxID=13616 RepID=UPI0024E2614A|nr:UL16-binding protein-like isoform X1 [Monodelphis domestica]